MSGDHLPPLETASVRPSIFGSVNLASASSLSVQTGKLGVVLVKKSLAVFCSFVLGWGKGETEYET